MLSGRVDRSHHCTLIHGGKARAVQRRAGRNQRRRHSLTVCCAGVDRDTAAVDALFRDQVLLGVVSTLSCELLAFSLVMLLLYLLICGRVTDTCDLRIGAALQVEGDIVKARLGFVVHTRRTLRVTLKVDGAESAGRRCWWRGWCFYGNGVVCGCCLTLIVNNVAGYRDGSRCRTRGGQRRGRSATGHRASRSAIAVGQRTILRAQTICGNRRGISRRNRRWARRATDRRWLVRLHRVLGRAICH